MFFFAEIKNLKNLNGFYGFSTFYSGLTLNNDFHGTPFNKINEISWSKVVLFFEQDEKNIFDLNYLENYGVLLVLSNNCPINTIRKSSLCLLNYLKVTDTEFYLKNIEKIFYKYSEYKEKLYYYLYEIVSESDGFDDKLILNKLKLFLIQYLGLEVNVLNLEVNIYIKDIPINEKLDISFIKSLEDFEEEENSLLRGYIIKNNDILLEVKFPGIGSIPFLEGLEFPKYYLIFNFNFRKIFKIKYFFK